LLSNLYLNEVDKMLEKAKETTRNGKYTYIEYARYADDLVILINAYPHHDWLLGAVDKPLREELAKLHVEDWVEKKVRRHLMRARKRRGFGWDRWSKQWLYETLGLFAGYGVKHLPKALPTG
jgi:RNA-directed DNA polymerase